MLCFSHFADPFNLDHNLGAGVTRKMGSYIQTTFIRGRERFGIPFYGLPVELYQSYFFDVYFLTDGHEVPADRNCRVCGKIGHIAKDCPHSKSNRRAEQKKEEEERKANQAEPGEKDDLSRKPFNAGPSRPRSASTPNKQGQNKSADNRTPLPTEQPMKIPSRQEASLTSLPRSQPDSDFVSPPVTEGQTDERRDDNSVNSCGMPSPQVSQAMSQVHTLQTSLTNVNAVTAQQGESTIDPNRTQMQPPQANVSLSIITNETGRSPTAMPSPRSSISGNQTNVAASTIQTTSGVSPSHAQGASPLLNHPQNMNPPPGFNIPDGTRQVPHTSSSGSPHTMADSMSPSPPVNILPTPRFEGNPITLNTPPRHQPGMFSPQGGYFVGSPSQHEMWLMQHGMMMLGHHSPLVRPIVPYPLTPELQVQAQIQQFRGPTDNLPIQHTGSPVHGQQPLVEHNHQRFLQNPPSISRNVMWPVGRDSPPPVSREQQFQGPLLPPYVSSSGMPALPTGSPQHIMHPYLSHGNSPSVPPANAGSPQYMAHGNPHRVAGSPQQIPRHIHFPHSPGMPPILGSPPQHMLRQPAPHQSATGSAPQDVPPQPLPQQPAFGTHMVSSPYWPYWFYGY